MAPLVIEGNTLGDIHHNYNKILNEAIKNKEIQISDINFEDSDIDNLLKIDIAGKNRNVEYLLKILKCHDMLYVSRAIKKNTWLVTEEEYAHIINPQHLFYELKQQMTSKAFNKLILHIRLNLRDEKRVEEFFNYYKDKDLEAAMKWLPHCSNAFIEKVLEKHANNVELTNDLVRRLCEKSMSFLDVYCKHNNQFYKREALFHSMFVMKKDVDKYLNIIESMQTNDMPHFRPKYTKLLMSKCRDRVMKNLDRYANCVDLATFAKFLTQDEAKDFIIKDTKTNILSSWRRDDKLKHFLNRLPIEDRFEFTKKFFIDKEYKTDVDSEMEDCPGSGIGYRSCPAKPNARSSQNIYAWYVFAPFHTAFINLKKLIRTESNPNERIAILSVILTTAGRNMENIQSLLKYYRENHINEPSKFKILFVNAVLCKTNAYKYDSNTWQYLKDIFTSMEVYSESQKNVQPYVKTILLYCIINDEEVPKIIEQKFEFETLSSEKKYLNQEEKNKVFNYLFNYKKNKIENTEVKNEKEFVKNFLNITDILNLLCEWDKNLKDYPILLEKIKQLIAIRQENTDWSSISNLFNINKSWRKLFFTESLLINPEQATVVNILKHDPKLIETHKLKINELLIDNINLDLFFKKVRVYWSQSLAKLFIEILMDNLQQNYSHKPFITGLCTLLPHKEITEMIRKHVPSESKIDWGQHDEVQLYIRKFLAMCLHLARPQPSLEMILLYAKGDYLQYALPSLNAILYNMSTADISKNITTLLNVPVSLQKHGLRTVISKLKHEDLKKILTDIWKSNKNSSIRADIFVHNFKMLCKEKVEESIKEMWVLLKMFIDNLTPEEDKKIYCALGEVKKVPICIRGDFWMKSYAFLKALPVKADCDSLVQQLIYNMTDVMEYLDDDFVANIFSDSFDKQFCNQNYQHAEYVASFLLSTKTEEAQMMRYKKVLLPMIEKSITVWDKQHNNVYFVRNNIYDIIKYLSSNLALVLSKDFVYPTKMFEEILDILQKKLLESENYILITVQNMAFKYVKILENVIKEEKEKGSESANDDKNSNQCSLFETLSKKVYPQFGVMCVEHLKQDVNKYFSSIYLHFAEALNEILGVYNYTDLEKCKTFNDFLADKDFVEGYLLALQGLSQYYYDADVKAFKSKMLETIRENTNLEIKMLYWLHYTNKNNF